MRIDRTIENLRSRITEKRLNMFNQNKVNQNKVEIVDKYDAYGNATGTKVIIQIFNP